MSVLSKTLLVVGVSATLAGAAYASEPWVLRTDMAYSVGMDGIQKSLVGALSCDKAMAIFKLCEYGASGDVSLGESDRAL
jgi:hypothetical protein